jgi:hypothetical protein
MNQESLRESKHQERGLCRLFSLVIGLGISAAWSAGGRAVNLWGCRA